MKAIIVGTGFGRAVYLPVLSRLGYEVVTVDLNQNADFVCIADAVAVHGEFDIAHICTPNFTHETLAREIAPHSKIVFVEKPGVANHAQWHDLVKDHDCRIMMVKNNQYREQMADYAQLVLKSHLVEVKWVSKHRVPNPGSWFTNKELAFGGVSRDLIPHMLSYYTALTDYHNGHKKRVSAMQNHGLDTIQFTDYGIINSQGVYDVDDYCMFEFEDSDGREWALLADWQNDKHDDSSITFHQDDGTVLSFQLGLCPEEAYEKMIVTAVENLQNEQFWKNQYQQDMWIHRQIEGI